MKTDQELKNLVKEMYSEIALQTKATNETGCCGTGCGCSTIDAALMAEDYSNLAGYAPDADLGLGCGLPTEFAQIKPGDVVVDLGSGAGNDAFVARSIVGPTGKVIGVDFTETMINKAKANAQKLNYQNVQFRHGDIEDLPIANATADVVVSNCVLNLVPNKQKAFSEMHRIIKPSGHFSVSDIVLKGDLPDALRKNAELYAGCVSGAISKDEYLKTIEASGFVDVTVQKEKKIVLPPDLLAMYLSPEELAKVDAGDLGIYSITVFGKKSNLKSGSEVCCGSECCN